MRTSDTVAAIYAALALAQGQFSAIRKEAANEYLGYRYATLEDALDVVRAPLAANGLALIQAAEMDERGTRLVLTTRLAHASGEWIESELTLPISEQKGLTPVQSIGVAITYARRYALMSLLGVAALGDDTDATAQRGRAAEPAEAKEAPQRPQAPKAAPGRQRRAQGPQEAPSREEAAAQLGAYKANLTTTQTAADVDDCVRSLVASLPGVGESAYWPRVMQYAEERKAVLAARPAPAPVQDDAPDEADSAAVNDPPVVGGDPETDLIDPETGEVLDRPTESEMLQTLAACREEMRAAQSVADLTRIIENDVRPFGRRNMPIFSDRITEAWNDLQLYYTARVKTFGANAHGAAGNV